MSAYLDIIILLLVVIMLLTKLRGIIGTRPEKETRISRESAAKIFDILMQEQNKKQKEENAKQELQAEENSLSDSEKTLRKIPNFSRDKFLGGAKRAFEIIITAFANGDIDILEGLVSNDLLKKFKDVIAQRKEDGIAAETDFIGFNEAVITDAEITSDETAKISVKFISEQVNILRDKQGNVLEGDENFIQSVTDIWTFERALNATTPNWLLVSTKK